MLDRFALKLVKPVIDAAAARLAARGVTADQATLAGFGFGMIAAVLIASGFTTRRHPAAARQPGARRARRRAGAAVRHHRARRLPRHLARLRVLRRDPAGLRGSGARRERLAAAVLLAAFIGTGTSFLAFAVMAEKRGLKSTAYPSKSFYYLGGLTEGTETILCFLAMCLWPAALRRHRLCLCRALRADRGDAAGRGLEDFRLTKFSYRGVKKPLHATGERKHIRARPRSHVPQGFPQSNDGAGFLVSAGSSKGRGY